VLIVGLLALSLPLSAILAVRMPNVVANAKAATTIMPLVTGDGDAQCFVLRRPKLDDVSAISLRAKDHDPVLAIDGHRHRSLPQSSSASRFTAGAFGFFILSQSGDRPLR
jgi:hypothetical protein